MDSQDSQFQAMEDQVRNLEAVVAEQKKQAVERLSQLTSQAAGAKSGPRPSVPVSIGRSEGSFQGWAALPSNPKPASKFRASTHSVQEEGLSKHSNRAGKEFFANLVRGQLSEGGRNPSQLSNNPGISQRGQGALGRDGTHSRSRDQLFQQQKPNIMREQLHKDRNREHLREFIGTSKGRRESSEESMRGPPTKAIITADNIIRKAEQPNNSDPFRGRIGNSLGNQQPKPKDYRSSTSTIRSNDRPVTNKEASSYIIMKNKRELERQSLMCSGDLSSTNASIQTNELIMDIIKSNDLQFKQVVAKVLRVDFVFGLLTVELRVLEKERKVQHLMIKEHETVLGLFRSESKTDNLLANWKRSNLVILDPDIFVCQKSQRKYLLIKFFRLVSSPN